MKHILHLKCLICGKEYQPDEVTYVCPAHGNEGILDVVYDYGRIAPHISPTSLAANRETSIWRYKPLLPVAPDAPTPPLAVGWTPLYKTDRLASDLGLQHVWVKDDGRNPTASFKDRASAMALVKARGAVSSQQLAVSSEQSPNLPITTASTGNAAAALAGLCASVGQPNVIFVPKSAPEAKVAQLLAFGATVLLVEGTYDDAFELCLQAAAEFGWYNRNTGYNPYMTEGKKTVSYEIAEQLGWQAPDVVFVSVGDGCIIGGVHKGFKDLLALGWIEQMPRLIGVQAAGSNYLAEAWAKGEDVLTKPPIKAETVADSISAGLPRDRIKAMTAVTQTNGAFITVMDEEILAAIPALARGCGVFAEPAGAAAYAGLVKAAREGLVQPADRIVVINTGSGLKDVAAAMKAVQGVGVRPYAIQPTLAAVETVLKPGG
ncbi:MAG: threonine synthase [Chloroflexi bacterium]|nr:threonine synthase [Ardenticatenaceae bacterium]MBL1128914.1 threonine synthase [Chloroflexota bacterium]NOG34993.1 threonine synthase [Chloroflexota bacterium]GIK55228.1 MAG: threonine synthase [Chloroflexota bacterium]